MRLASFLLVLMLIGCSSAPAATTPPPRTQTTPEVQEEWDIPDWGVNIPSEPGQAFYGVGSAAVKSPTQLALAQQTAATAARRQIADTMRTTIQGATKRYARQILTDDGTVHEEAFSQDVTRSVTNFVASGVAIQTYYISKKPDPKTGLRLVWALARIGFDAVAESLHNEAAKRIDQVRRNADAAFADLDRMLKEEQEKEAAARQPELQPIQPQ